MIEFLELWGMPLLVFGGFIGLVVGIFVGLMRVGIRLDKERRQDLADRINAGRK